MLKTIPGFPRIGKSRELKFLIEDYFKGLIDDNELIEKSKKIESENFSLLKDNIDILPVNDFSFYDNMLDMAWALGAIEPEYYNNKLSLLKKYFAIARGYQDHNIDLKAYEMKKWFTTNYHYIVPRLSDKLAWETNFEFLKYRLDNAKSNKINYKFVIIGPFTFIKLSKTVNNNELGFDFLDKIIKNYLKIFEFLRQNNVKYLQIDEPAFVMDLNDSEKSIIIEIYKKLLNYNSDFKIILQTYFGDIRDIYTELMQLAFYGIGLDFVDGEYNIELIEKHGYDKNKILIAGIINGRNIWKLNYGKVCKKLDQITKYVTEDNLWLSTSTSLLHIPYSLDFEKNIPPEIKAKISFAKEKLEELNKLEKFFIEKKFIKEEENLQINEKEDKIFKFTEKDFKREKEFFERYKIQKENLNLPLLPTTTIGSFPQIEEIRKIRKKFKNGEITEEEYETYIKEQIEKLIKIQNELGLDILVHGEFERNDMVEYFAQFLTGILYTDNGWIQSYGTRMTKPPIIYGDIMRKKPMTVKWIKYAQSLTEKPVKAILTGPVTIINWSYVREDIDIKNIAFHLALALRDEINELQKENIKIIQVDEAALREKVPLRKSDWSKYFDWAINSFKLATSCIKPDVQLHTHMCYSEFGEIVDYIEQMDADVISIEAAKSDLEILTKIKDYSQKRQIGPGVYDIHSPRIPSKDEIKKIILNILKIVSKENLWINPDCGLKTRKFEECIPALKNMVEAVKEIREQL